MCLHSRQLFLNQCWLFHPEQVDAMKDVNPDELFKKATEHGDSGLKKSNEEALEDAVVGNFIDFLNGIANMLND